MIRFILDQDNRLISASKSFHCGSNELVKDQPKEFKLNEMRDWQYINGAFVHNPLIAEEPQDRVAKLEQEIQELLQANEMLTECILEMSSEIYGE